jgi:hypothetical protein
MDKINNIRVIISYFLAKAYQFCGTFPRIGDVIVPNNYDSMSWWHFTHFLCLLSNKIYPDKVENGVVTASMTFAIKDLVWPESTYEEFLIMLKRDGLSKFGEPK